MKKRLLSTILALCLMLTLLPGTAWASAKDGQVDLKPANEVRWIDRAELPDYALRLYEVLEEAVDGDGYNDYLIDDRYYDLDGGNIRTDVPGEFIRGTVGHSDGSTTRYTAVVVTAIETAAADQSARDYIKNCICTVLSAFKFDHQEVFWINGQGIVGFDRNDGKTYYGLTLCSRRSSKEGGVTSYYELRREDFRPGGKWDIRRAMARRDADVEEILRTIPAGADRFTQIYYLNDWLSEHNKFNSLVSSGEANPWYAYECISALEGLDGKEGPVCSGYSAAFKVLCGALGIPCVTVQGLGGSGGAHRWNYAQMEDGKWYAVDVNYNSDSGGANRTLHLLVGGKTVISSKEFRQRHTEQNRAYYGGVENFLNGPVLSDEAYPRGVHLAYRGMPEKLTLGDPVAMTPVLIFDPGAAYTYASTALPAGLALNPKTGEITGTVTGASNPVTVTVTATAPDDPADCAKCTLMFPAVEKDAGTVALKHTNEVRWIDRLDVPDHALAFYAVLEEAADGDGYHDYLIDDEYFDLSGDFDASFDGKPGDFKRLDFGDACSAAIVVAVNETAAEDEDAGSYSLDCIQKVSAAFQMDHPEVFWRNGPAKYLRYRYNGKTYYCYLLSYRSKADGDGTEYYEARIPAFQFGGERAVREAMAQRDADIEKILSTVPAGADRFTQVYYLNEWLTQHNQYNTTNVSDGDKSKRPWYAWQSVSALAGSEGVDGPVCQGYAYAFKVLCDALGIPCVSVDGNVQPVDEAHMWNYVQMEDGKWYAVDVTFNDGADRTKWLLVGGKTELDGMEFLASHPVENECYDGNYFPNGPVLSDGAYPRGVHLAYWGMPEKLTPGAPVAMTPALIFDPGAAYTYTSTTLPAGLALNPKTGEITGTVTDASRQVTVTVTAADPDDSADCAQCTLTFQPAEPPEFTDVPDWGKAEVAWGAAKGIVLGIGGDLFGSFNTCTHDEILTFLWRAAGRPKAAQAPVKTAYDIPDFQAAINWAYEKHMIGTSFQSAVPCTRASSVKYIWQATGMKSAPASDFPDVPSGAPYAPAVDWAAANGITVGTGDGRFNPDGTCTRVEIVIFLYRAYEV